MGPQKNVAVVAPVQLGNALMVLLQSAPGIRPMACATNIKALLPALASEIPDVILLYIDEDATSGKEGQVTHEQVSRGKAAWPEVYCIVFISNDQLRGKVQESGADTVLLEGITPSKILEIIDSYDPNEKKRVVPVVETADPTGMVITLEDQLKQLGKNNQWWKVWKKGTV